MSPEITYCMYETGDPLNMAFSPCVAWPKDLLRSKIETAAEEHPKLEDTVNLLWRKLRSHKAREALGVGKEVHLRTLPSDGRLDDTAQKLKQLAEATGFLEVHTRKITHCWRSHLELFASPK